MQDSLTIKETAYKKIVFHSLRYPNLKVFGTPLLIQAPS